MFTDALFRWSVPACPVNVFLDIALADRLRAAVVASEVEIGGFLVGRFEKNKTIVTDFELVESEHRRGTAYALSQRDDQHLLAKLAASRKKRLEVVGFFRSHMRPGMFLDAADSHTISGHFSGPQQVALLVRPGDDGAAIGGFFFWQDGEMDRKATSLAFPMSSAELESETPNETRLSQVRPSQTDLGFDAAETLDGVSKVEPRRVTPAPAVSVRTPSWLWIGLVAAGAALGGYLVGTGGNREHFGSRPGDITISDAPPTAPAPVVPAPVKKVVNAEAPPSPAPQLAPPQAMAPPIKVAAAPDLKKTTPAVSRRPAAEELSRKMPPPSVSPVPQEPVPTPIPEPPPPVETAPAPAPKPVAPAPVSDAAVDLETPQDGGIKRALHHIFGAHAQNFQPAQVLKRTTPRLSAEVSRTLTAEVPVTLKLRVDNTGRVSSIELLSHGINSALVQSAGNAAYQWQFQPAQLKDKPVASDVIAHFVFKPSL